MYIDLHYVHVYLMYVVRLLYIIFVDKIHIGKQYYMQLHVAWYIYSYKFLILKYMYYLKFRACTVWSIINFWGQRWECV